MTWETHVSTPFCAMMEMCFTAMLFRFFVCANPRACRAAEVQPLQSFDCFSELWMFRLFDAKRKEPGMSHHYSIMSSKSRSVIGAAESTLSLGRHTDKSSPLRNALASICVTVLLGTSTSVIRPRKSSRALAQKTHAPEPRCPSQHANEVVVDSHLALPHAAGPQSDETTQGLGVELFALVHKPLNHLPHLLDCFSSCVVASPYHKTVKNSKSFGNAFGM